MKEVAVLPAKGLAVPPTELQFRTMFLENVRGDMLRLASALELQAFFRLPKLKVAKEMQAQTLDHVQRMRDEYGSANWVSSQLARWELQDRARGELRLPKTPDFTWVADAVVLGEGICTALWCSFVTFMVSMCYSLDLAAAPSMVG